jgi:hypothetical protein
VVLALEKMNRPEHLHYNKLFGLVVDIMNDLPDDDNSNWQLQQQHVFADNHPKNDNSTMITMKGLGGATLTIFLTTLEDAIWLIPFCLYASTTTIRMIHSFLFISTFTGLSTMICIITVVLQYYTTETILMRNINKKNTNEAESIISMDGIHFYSNLLGAILCWCFALYFYWKAYQKRKWKRQKQQQQQGDVENEKQPLVSSSSPSSDMPLSNSSVMNPSAEDQKLSSHTFRSNHNTIHGNDNVKKQEDVPKRKQHHHHQQPQQEEEGDLDYGSSSNSDENTLDPTTDREESTNRITRLHVITVMTLTIIGALDEVSYFPSLLLGHIFTPYEMIIGTILASVMELLVVFFFLSSCQPILHFLDQIPIYLVIMLFAILLSCEVLWDIFV